MDFIELSCVLENPIDENKDVLAAFLGDIGYDSFEFTESGLNAYIYDNLFSEDALTDLKSSSGILFDYTFSIVLKKNWNEEWEKNFQPVYIKNFCQIRAPFHSKQEGFQLDVQIVPKMSFGTGHHPTTRLMIEKLFSLNFADKMVLDMGSGTGILAVISSMLGAKSVVAIDIDEWAYENTMENAALNNVTNIISYTGGIELMSQIEPVDFILANINRNILMEQIPFYVRALNNNGYLLLSGFLTEDVPDMKLKAEFHSLIYESCIENSGWSMLMFRKI